MAIIFAKMNPLGTDYFAVPFFGAFGLSNQPKIRKISLNQYSLNDWPGCEPNLQLPCTLLFFIIFVENIL
ncbi:MAG: hypothetical protein EA411_05905 [Saprospirales bacterium]|nr:MAG: hypothetical protein EA411_05905 [Saprospirales bacterium]